MPTLRIAVTITLCITLVGCSEKPQSIVFDISGKESNRSYSFFTIVEENGKLVLGSATAKIADASGYQDWEISARYPQNLASPWRTSRLNRHKRVGIVVLKRDKSNKPILKSARAFWFDTETISSREDNIDVRLPAFDSLPLIAIEPHWQ
jgi:hypothetical protein